MMKVVTTQEASRHKRASVVVFREVGLPPIALPLCKLHYSQTPGAHADRPSSTSCASLIFCVHLDQAHSRKFYTHRTCLLDGGKHGVSPQRFSKRPLSCRILTRCCCNTSVDQYGGRRGSKQGIVPISSASWRIRGPTGGADLLLTTPAIEQVS